MKTKNVYVLSVLLLLINFASYGQIKMPQASPSTKVTQQVGLTNMALEYSRPSKRERKIFGELVPYGAVWRTGANNATTLAFDTEVIINGNRIPSGKYALYTIPGKGKWDIILSTNTQLWGSIGYTDADDVVRFSVPAKKLKNTVETMEINFSSITDTGTTVGIQWDKTRAEFRVETEVDPVVMQQIKEMIIDKNTDNAGLYFQAANYYYNNNKDLRTALEWIEKSVEADPKYWTVHLKAKIEHSLGMKEEAKKTALQSMELAREANNPDYVGLNERLIKSIK
jgi:hypothetical protein